MKWNQLTENKINFVESENVEEVENKILTWEKLSSPKMSH